MNSTFELVVRASTWLWWACVTGITSLAGPRLSPKDFQAAVQENTSESPSEARNELGSPGSQARCIFKHSLTDIDEVTDTNLYSRAKDPQPPKPLIRAVILPPTLWTRPSYTVPTVDAVAAAAEQHFPPSLSSTMVNKAALSKTLQALQDAAPGTKEAAGLLSTAKKQMAAAEVLIPDYETNGTMLPVARAILEAGALLSIRAQDYPAFTRYYQQLAPFYAMPLDKYKPESSRHEHQRSKITGLYLMQLLAKGDYAAFHTLLEGLEADTPPAAATEGKGVVTGVEHDRFIRYPVELEQALMEGAYDRVWKATKGEGVPSEEFSVFSEILIGTIRDEIASCSEKAYPSIPVANAKNLLFLDSEGSVVHFAKQRGWEVHDGRLYFPAQQNEGIRTEKEILVTSGTVLENTIGYARELEMIV